VGVGDLENGHETGYNVGDMVQKHINGMWKVYIMLYLIYCDCL